MPGFALFGGRKDEGEQSWGDLSQRDLSLMNEADWAQAGEPSHVAVHIDAFPDEGAIYVSDSSSDDYDTSFHYGDGEQADNDLLTALNGSWNG